MNQMDQVMGELFEVLNEAKNRILLYAQASMSQSQFEAFRKLFLDEMGRSGVERRIVEIFKRFGGKGRREIESDARGSGKMI